MQDQGEQSDLTLTRTGRNLPAPTEALARRGLDLLSSRTIQFPDDRSLGTVFWRTPSKPRHYREVVGPLAHISGRMADARALVRVPADSDVTLSVRPEEVPDLKPLTSLRPDDLQGVLLGFSTVADDDLVFLRGLTHLKMLKIGPSSIGDDGMAHIEGLTELRGLDIRCTKVTSKGMMHVRGMTDLIELDLPATPVGDSGLSYLRNLSKLETLGLHDTQITDEGLAHLSELTSLRKLFVMETSVKGAGLPHLRYLPSLWLLNASCRQIDDSALKAFPYGFRSLSRLVLNDTSITGAGLVHLQHLSELTYLSLRGTKLSDSESALSALSTLTNLKSLSLTDTGLTRDQVKRLKDVIPDCIIYLY